MELFIPIAALILGLVFGSFLNVCISRIPRDQSIVWPPSHCPACSAAIAWPDNIPLLSWILLRGRCRCCGSRISLRYPAVELLTAVLFVLAVSVFGLTLAAVKACLLGFLLVGLIFADAETGLLPAEFTYLGIVAGLVFAWFVPLDTAGSRFLLETMGWHSKLNGSQVSLLDAVLAAVIIAGFFLLAWALYYLVRKRDGLGFGDIAFAAMIGTFLGLKLTFLVLFLAPVLGSVFAIGYLVLRSRTAGDSEAAVSPLLQSVPFGVFLGISALFAFYGGEWVWRWYLGFFT